MKIGDENNKYQRGEITNQDLISEDINEIKERLQGLCRFTKIIIKILILEYG